MSQESELKLLIHPTQRDAALKLCAQFGQGTEAESFELTNSYFDTEDLRLRQFDIGLRIRANQTEREQTIKLAGQVLGGMHKRPEYNVAVQNDQPDLTLFDSDIWPDEFPLFDIQRDLHEIFRTDFTRHRWRIASGEGQIEIVFDEGQIIAGDKQRPICEVELEVQGGLSADAYKMARRLITRVQACVGSQSKAARGYLLAEKTVLEPFTQAHFVPLGSTDDIGAGLYKALTYALHYWQHNDSCLRENPSVRAVAGITDGIRLSRVVLQQLSQLEVDVADYIVRLEQMLGHLGWLSRYDGLTELTAEDGAYHRALKQYPKLYEHIQEQQEHSVQMELVVELSKRDDYQMTLLELGELCFDQPRHDESMNSPLQQWATQRLREDWQAVADTFARDQEWRAEHYLKQLTPLQNSLQLGYCVGAIFPTDDREQFRAPWLDMVRGIREIMALKLLREAIKDTDEVNTEKLLGWQAIQLETLLYALDHSRRAALKQEPYWDA